MLFFTSLYNVISESIKPYILTFYAPIFLSLLSACVCNCQYNDNDAGTLVLKTAVAVTSDLRFNHSDMIITITFSFACTHSSYLGCEVVVCFRG